MIVLGSRFGFTENAGIGVKASGKQGERKGGRGSVGRAGRLRRTCGRLESLSLIDHWSTAW